MAGELILKNIQMRVNYEVNFLDRNKWVMVGVGWFY